MVESTCWFADVQLLQQFGQRLLIEVVNLVSQPLQMRFPLHGNVKFDESLRVVTGMEFVQQLRALPFWIISDPSQNCRLVMADDAFLEQEADDVVWVDVGNHGRV